MRSVLRSATARRRGCARSRWETSISIRSTRRIMSRSACRLANSLKPDVIFLTGDYVTSTSDRIGEFAGLLAKLSPRAGVFACLGNHDHWSNAARVAGALKAAALRCSSTSRRGCAAPAGNWWWRGCRARGAACRTGRGPRADCAADERAVVLMHEPDFARTLSEDRRIALQLSGHTHGGQVRVPFVGALRLPTWGRIYQAGFYDVDGLKLHVNRGIGTIELSRPSLLPAGDCVLRHHQHRRIRRLNAMRVLRVRPGLRAGDRLPSDSG